MALAEPVSNRSLDSSRRGSTNVFDEELDANVRPTRRWIRIILRHQCCDAVLGFMILCNAVYIGVEQMCRREGEVSMLVHNIGVFFLVAYVLELTLRFYAFGMSCVRDNYVKLDAVLVLVAVLTDVFLADLEIAEELKATALLRIARMARVARSLRLFEKFPGMWTLLQGISNSASTIFYAIVLLSVTLYTFASLGFEIITLRAMRYEPPDEVAAIIEEYFSTVPKTMLSLVQFVTMDSLGAIYRPLVIYQPGLALYFVLLILIVSILIMNIITAALVNGAIETASQDREAKRADTARRKKKLMRKLHDAFLRLDQDGSGFIEKAEIENAADSEVLGEFLNADPMAVFDSLDVDESGCVSIDEFCEGLYEHVTSNVPIEIKRMDKRLANIHRRLCNLQEDTRKSASNGWRTSVESAPAMSIWGMMQEVWAVQQEIERKLCIVYEERGHALKNLESPLESPLRRSLDSEHTGGSMFGGRTSTISRKRSSMNSRSSSPMVGTRSSRELEQKLEKISSSRIGALPLGAAARVPKWRGGEVARTASNGGERELPMLSLNSDIQENVAVFTAGQRRNLDSSGGLKALAREERLAPPAPPWQVAVCVEVTAKTPRGPQAVAEPCVDADDTCPGNWDSEDSVQRAKPM
eukprot:TRINITY_DN13752_c0_g1_i2.p1 TRINITY_DN13752_c0_g1~~TRINITY_DN13752_c0_g1_i2.p1  ORF type:complete len:641 (+),score=92.89 TRINITY_DN13752_c0_g1_i2:93-2015(+)